MKYRVYLNTGASASVTVDVPDDIAPEERREYAIERAFDIVPRDVCAQCGGWGRDYGLDLGEWDVDEGDDAVKVVE